MMMYKIYWTDPTTGDGKYTTSQGLVIGLKYVSTLRDVEMLDVVLVAMADTNQVGALNTNVVQDGKLPNGEDYTYKKQDALSQRMK